MTNELREVKLEQKSVYVRVDGLATWAEHFENSGWRDEKLNPFDVGKAVKEEFQEIVEQAILTGQAPDTDFVDAEYTVIDDQEPNSALAVTPRPVVK